MRPSHTHSGQRALVTAAASGIGRVIAKGLLDAGAQVFICDADAAQLARTLGEEPRLKGCLCDVSDESQVRGLFGQALAHLGGLDILVNNAGIAGPTAPVEDITLEDWRRCMAVNLDGSLLCAREAAPVMRRQGGGSIINMSSTGGLFGFPRRAPYASAKWAIRGFTRTLAQELGPHGVRVNCICPGSVSGERIDRVIAAEARATGQTPQEVRRSYTDAVSLRAFVTPEDIAQTVLFLTSAAGARISGQDITVDGHTETL